MNKRLLILAFALLIATSALSQTRDTTQMDNKGKIIVPVVKELKEILSAFKENKAVLEFFVKRYGPHHALRNATRRQFAIDDSIALIKVISIVNTYGWKGTDNFGEEGPTAIIIAFLHAGITQQKKYFPLMEKAVTEGNLPPEGFALIADRIALKEQGQQIYGTQVKVLLGRYEPLPIATPNELDERRSRIGLGNYLRFLATYNPTYLNRFYLY